MNKSRVFTLVMVLSLTGMGLASRDWRHHSGGMDLVQPYETHLRMYREIRPVLLGASAGERLLCKAGGEE
ncbi:MAG: hypothetical protein ACT4PS_03115 [Betaproteobacteria bacterium]